MTLFYDNGLFTWINVNIQLFSFFMNGGGGEWSGCRLALLDTCASVFLFYFSYLNITTFYNSSQVVKTNRVCYQWRQDAVVVMK